MRKHLFKWMLLLVAFMVPGVTNAQMELTVADGTATNSNVPIYGNWADAYLRCQTIYPAELLDEMMGGTIESVTYYLSSPAAQAWTGTWEIKLVEVDATTLSGWQDVSDATTVYTGTLDATSSPLEITFTTPYTYNGGNLLIEVSQTTKGNYKSCTFYGMSATAASWQGYNSSSWDNITGSAQGFIPKTTFSYAPGDVQICYKPTDLNVIPSAYAAAFSWTPVEGAIGYQALYTLTTDEAIWDDVEETGENAVTFEELTPSTSYYAYVRTICDFGVSKVNRIPFTTPCAFYTVNDDQNYAYGFEEEDLLPCWTLGSGATRNSSSSAAYEGTYSLRLYGSTVIAVMPGFEETSALQVDFFAKLTSSTSSTLQVGYMTNPTDASTFVPLTTLSSADFSTSTYTPVNVPLMNVPEGARVAFRHTSSSSYVGWYLDNFVVSPLPSCVAPTGVTANSVTASSASISWTPAFESDNTWELAYSTDGEEWISVGELSETIYELNELADDTPYQVRVRTVCGDEEQSIWSAIASFTTQEMCPEGKICVGTGKLTSTSIPANNYYKYSLTEQIYTAEELGEAGAILSMDFYKKSTTAMTKTLNIYMVATDKTAFESTTDWVAVTAADLVFSGEVTFDDNAWTTIDLDNPFIYDGSSNIVLVIDNNTGAYVSSTAFYAFTTTGNQAIYYQSDQTDLDPMEALTTAGNLSSSKNRVRFVIGEPPSCPKPTAVAVNYEGGTTATVSWTSDASAWNISVNGEVIENVENPYTLTDLQLGTTYEVMVQANCDGAVSEWSNPASFTTDLCMPENMCELTFELADTYGDSWNGCAIRVIDAATGEVIADMAGTEEAEANEVQTFTLAVCDGRDLQFVWKSGSYANETSYTVKDINGEEIFSGAGVLSNTVNYTVSCAVSSCRKPTELTMAGRSAHSLTVEWTENGEANEWVVAYKTPDEEEFVEAGSADTNFTITNLTASQLYTVKVRPVCDDEAIKWSNATTFMTLPGNTMPANVTVEPITYDATVSWEAIITNELHESYDLYWATADVTAIPEQLEAPNYVSGITATSYQITGLEALTDYRVWVRDNCGNDGVSAWTTPVDFSTLGDCPAPVLTEDGITNVAAHTADVEWAGYEANNSYEVTYWTAAGFDGVAEEFGGTSLPSGWENKSGLLSTVMDGGALGSSTKWYFGTANGVFDSHARINIYGSSCNGWLITPEMTVPENGVMNFDLALTAYSGSQAPAANTSGTDDRFVVLVYANDQWNILREWNNVDSAYIYNNIPNTGENVTIDISEYAGQNVKFAFYGESTTSNADNNLHIDNVAIGLPIAAGEPQTLLVDENQVTLTGLDPETVYQVQVTGLCANDSTNASAVISFITDVACPAPEETAVELGENGEVSLFVSSMLDEDAIYEYQYWSIDDEENVVTLEGEDYLSVVLPAGSYAWQVRSICGEDGYSEWTEGESFTICLPYEVTIETPFVMDLNAEEVDLSCWDSYGTGSWTVTSTNWFKNNGYTGDMYLVSPAIQLPESGEAILSFDEMYNYVDDYGQSSVYVVLEDGDVEDVEPFWTADTTALVDQVVESRELSLNEYLGQTIRVIFRYEGNNAHDWYVNNIMVAVEEEVAYYERNIIDTVCDQYELTNSNGDVLAVYTESGEYENIYEDSVYGMVHAVLNLTINYSTSNIDEQTACDAYTWPLNNMTYTESTDSAFFVFVNEQGCPHITTLNLTLYYKEHSYTEVSSCGPYTWELTGATYNKSGMKFNKGTTAEGCQIRDTLVLTVVERWGSYTKVANCGPYTWDKTGTTYNKSGLKFFKDTADDGCPVRDTLELTIVERWGSYTEATSCGPYIWDKTGQTYNNGGLKFSKSYANDGCEIRDTLNLIITEVGGGSHEYVKNCGPYTWELTGQTYNKSGEKIYTTVDSVDGCFHRDTLTLTVVTRWGSYTELNYCGPYTWEKTGQTYNKSGLKFYKGTSEDGCEVRDTLNLKIENRFHSYTEVANCGPYTWDLTGQTYSKSGMKFRKDTAENGCLIRDTLVLTVVDRWSSYTKVANCGPYTWDKTGQTYNKSGLKFYKSVAEDGCPIRDTLELTVVTKWSSNDTVVSCDAPYTWDKTGQTYKKTGLKFFKGTAADGCPIRDTLYVIIGQSEHSYNEVTSYGPYTWDLTGKTYNKSGLKFNKGTNADGCPVRDTLNLIVLESNTGAESYEYEIAENESPIEAPETIEAAQLTSLNAVKVYPNPTTGRIQINVTEAEKVEVLDLVGRLVAVYENTNTLDLTNLADGTYTLRITMAEGVALRKVVKR